MVTDDITTALVGYLRENLTGEKVFKGEKTTKTKMERYVCVNCLPVYHGEALNQSARVNVNVHTRRKTDGTCDTGAMNTFCDTVLALFPKEEGIEDCEALDIDGFTFVRESESNPTEDTDDTYYVNISLRVYFPSF